jgi:hypothetical protein
MSNLLKTIFANKFKVIIAVSVLTFISIGSLVIAQKITNKTSKVELESLKGNWSLSYTPYSKDDNLQIPAFVSSVTSKDKGAKVINIFNSSKKEITSVKFRWLVYTDDARTRVLAQGETRMLEFDRGLESGKGGKIQYKIVSLSDFYQQFLDKNNTLNKDFIVEILASEVVFSDDSIWKKDENSDGFIRAELIERAVTRNTACARQKCKSNPNPEVKDGVYYTCEPSSTRENCANSGDTYSCNNVSCDRPKGVDDEVPIIVIGEV